MNTEKDSGGVWFTNIPTALTPGEDPHLQALTLLCPLTGRGRRGGGGMDLFCPRLGLPDTARLSVCGRESASTAPPRGSPALLAWRWGRSDPCALCSRSEGRIER